MDHPVSQPPGMLAAHVPSPVAPRMSPSPPATALTPGLLVLHGNRLEDLAAVVFDFLARHPLGAAGGRDAARAEQRHGRMAEDGAGEGPRRMRRGILLAFSDFATLWERETLV